MTVYAQQSTDHVLHVFSSEGAAEMYVKSELAKARASGHKEPIWVIWDAPEGEPA